MAGCFWELACALNCDVWVDRVPTAANCADYPTRLDPGDANGYARAVEALGFEWTQPGNLGQLWVALARLRAASSLQ